MIKCSDCANQSPSPLLFLKPNNLLLLNNLSFVNFDNLLHSDGPKFTKGAGHVAVDPGQEATLHCHVDANPSPSIVWTKKDDTR